MAQLYIEIEVHRKNFAINSFSCNVQEFLTF